MESAQRSGSSTFRIGKVARITGLPVRRIRYYERRGLLEPAARSEAGYRLYTAEEVARLEFVKRAKLLGLTLEEISELVSLAARCGHGEIVPQLRAALDAKLSETERKLAELETFRQSLLYYRERAGNTGEAGVESHCSEASFCECLEVITADPLPTKDHQRGR